MYFMFKLLVPLYVHEMFMRNIGEKKGNIKIGAVW